MDIHKKARASIFCLLMLDIYLFQWGSGSVSNVTFEIMIVESASYTTSYLSGMPGSWLTLFVEGGKVGVGPTRDVYNNNVLVLNTAGALL